MTDPIQLDRTPVHLSTRSSESFQPLEGFNFDGESFQGYISRLCSADDPGCLVMIESSPVSWGTWEVHPDGDELVVILSGAGTFIQETESGSDRIEFKAGDTILNRRGVWHTADITEPVRALYITTCPGTDHKPRNA